LEWFSDPTGSFYSIHSKSSHSTHPHCQGFGWVTIDDHLDLFVAANMPSIGADTQPSPLAHLCDGAVDLCVARACSRTVGVQVR
jgi:hypothetical protein